MFKFAVVQGRGEIGTFTKLCTLALEDFLDLDEV